nr:unnamed protein product [Spirometra erinaceieuropaei]
MVFSATVRLSGEMISPAPRGAVEDPTNLLHRLRQFMRALSPVPPGSSASPSYLEDLATCSHVYLRCDRVRRPLAPPYDGPFGVLSRGTRTFRTQHDNREEVVSGTASKLPSRTFLWMSSVVPYLLLSHLLVLINLAVFPLSPLSATSNCHV